MQRKRIAFRASQADSAQTALRVLERRYGTCALDAADCVVALGGDGFMLDTLHTVMANDQPVYGMNRGSVGFLMNDYTEEDLPERLDAAHETRISPLRMVAHTVAGERIEALAINEVSLLRETRQAAKLRISVDGAVRLPELICDGAILATPAGSTAYNLSAHGPILPIESRLLALTPISAFRPRRWRGALLPETASVRFEPLEAEKRPVSAVADTVEARAIRDVRISADRSIALRLLFDPDHGLDERILREQFVS